MVAQVSDVFLSHNSVDKPIVEEIARRLLMLGITPWLDKWNLVPGEPWQEAIESALDNCNACAVFIGPGGAGPWQNEEMRAAIDRRVKDRTKNFRVIPVFLPGAPTNNYASLPMFLKRQTGVEFQNSIDNEDDFNRLVSGIRGKAPGSGITHAVAQNICPYKGLQSFDVNDSNFFFGRESLRDWVITKINPPTGAKQDLRFLGILGPSGSGKSSLARAGVLAALKQYEPTGNKKWSIAICRPGIDPVENLVIALAGILNYSQDVVKTQMLIESIQKDDRALHLALRLALYNPSHAKHCVILVDQFEELFTLCDDEAIRRSFLNNLIYAAGVIEGIVTIIITMRTDFYGKCATYPSLARVLSTHQILIGKMSRAEMTSSIEQPAKITGFEFEPGLVDLLLDDAMNESGALPLLQHALLELWEKREGRRFTLSAYYGIGRLVGAIERRAEYIFNHLESEEQSICQKILLRLVQLGQGTDATKRRLSIRELYSSDDEHKKIEDIILKLAESDARLVTTNSAAGYGSEPVVEISHEALIKNWGRLRNWIEENRQDLIIQNQITTATNEWLSNSKNMDFLFHGSRLVQALEWMQVHQNELNDDEREFLQESKEKVASELRLQDTSILDQLEASSENLWLNFQEMRDWLIRADRLLSSLDTHQRQLEKYRNSLCIDASSDQQQEAGVKNKELQFKHDTLAVLIRKMERFRDGLAVAAKHVVKVCPELFSLTVEGCAKEWEQTIASIKNKEESPMYNGLQIVPQIGLIPIGRDPTSGLFEFAHIQTGEVPVRDHTGRLILTELSGIVFILIPSGTFTMGSEKPSESRPLGDANIDTFALDDESPVHAVTLNAFFISKYAMTQGQWIRATGNNPSMFRPNNLENSSLKHPVECVNWHECNQVSSSMGIEIPTEAQWEYAARAGTVTMWWIGNDETVVREMSNLETARHEPVDFYKHQNQFGLCDVIGNVWEWCKDWYGTYNGSVNDGDGERKVSGATHRVSRGGSFFNTPAFARSAIRYYHTLPDAKFNNRGFRPGRSLSDINSPIDVFSKD